MITKEEKEKLLEWDRTHINHPQYPFGQKLRGLIWEKGKGAKLWDAEGKEYIDFCSHLQCVNLGYSQSELVAAATEQMQKLPYSTTFFGYSHRPLIECSMKLAELTPGDLDHCIFTCGGSESVEVALMVARRYWRNQGKDKYKILSQYNGYHGVSFGAITATGMGKGVIQQGLEPLVSGIIQVPNYNCYRCMLGHEYPQCDIQCAKYLAEIIEWEGPDTVAAVILEPCMGPGGFICPPPEYLPRVREICTKHDVLLIDDEIGNGFCRTGKMFSADNWGVVPDMMVLAKGITSAYFPVGAVAISDKVWGGFEGSALPGNYTYSGHPVGCAIAVKAMEIYVRDKIAERVSEVSKPMYERLRAEFLPLPCVGNVGGLGFYGGIEIVADKTTKRMFAPTLNIMKRIQAEVLEKGLYIRTCSQLTTQGDRIPIDPPLVIMPEDIDRGLDILYSVLANIKPD
ncbi:aspartate aminotransferase family protein [Chloroflexota bacterium]